MRPVVGINPGNAATKAVAINPVGERAIEPFVSQIAEAATHPLALRTAPSVAFEGSEYWYGGDADLGAPVSMHGLERYQHPALIPVLTLAAFAELGLPANVAALGACLPAAWMQTAPALAGLLRQAVSVPAGQLHILPEPVAAAYSVLLDEQGEIVDSELTRQRVGVVDIGGGTTDIAILDEMRLVIGSAQTASYGANHAIGAVASILGGTTGRQYTHAQATQVVRHRSYVHRGVEKSLPDGWERPFDALATHILAFLDGAWRDAGDLDVILLAGGGATEPLIADRMRQRYPHARSIEEPQQAVARGCARRALMAATQEVPR